ncbi:hypothetical protein [Klebsiella aerogenes]|uniref:hypothetical protein n=1 Tax=Klebsiella aerogenes TaxID=548 RepID=UPI003890D0F5|nr:hypothetical protein [Klebsiella aerogenes]
MKNLCGNNFLALLKHGVEIDQLIKRRDRDEIAQHTTTDMMSLSHGQRLSPSPLVPACIYLILIVIFSVNAAFILQSLQLTPPRFLAFYFPLLLGVIVITSVAAGLVGRGHAVGLRIFMYLYLANLFVFCLVLALAVIADEAIAANKVIFFMCEIAVLWLGRRLMNGTAFTLFTLYRLTIRLAMVAQHLNVAR